MSEILVQFAGLQEASQNITTALNTLRSKLDDLQREAAPLVAIWDGEARQAYEQRQQAWNSAANDIADILHRINQALQHSAEQYQATERSNANLFS
jgi:early secretory antigenic target protein ESAT-6